MINKQKQTKWLMQNLLTGKKRLKGFRGEWEKVKLGDVATIFSGGTPISSNGKYYASEGIAFIRSGEISSDRTELFITQEGLDDSSAKMVDVGDLLYALYGATSGECSISKMKGAINQAILCIRSKIVNTKILYYSLRNAKDKIISTYIQGGQGNLSADIIKNINLFIPKDIREQESIVDILSQADREIELLQHQLEQTKLEKKSMMQLLLTGIVRVNQKGGE